MSQRVTRQHLLQVFFSEDVDGWQWDRRSSPGATSDNTRYLTYVGGHEHGLLDGTKLEHWQSGVLDGIEYVGMAHIRIGDDLTWTPMYTTGSFTTYWDDRELYSDWSFSENAELLVGDRTVLPLREDAVYNSISATLYKRLPTFEISTIKQAQLVQTFTGVLSGRARVQLAEGLPSDWSQVETRKLEMLVQDGALYFNQDMSVPVGNGVMDLAAIKGGWEYKNNGLSEGRPLFAEYFRLRKDL